MMQNQNPSIQRENNLKPFLSVICIIITLFSLVFLQMEERRVGYSLLKLSKEHKKIVENRRHKMIQLAKITRPQQVEKVAQSKSTLKKLSSHQIIHLTGVSNRDLH